MIEDTTGNSSTDEKDFFDEVAESVVDDSGDFFDDLEKDVNGIVYDAENDSTNTNERVTPEERQNLDVGSAVTEDSAASGGIDWDSENNPYKKRYSDSSREAGRLKGKLDDLGQYDAIIDVMKKDPTLVNKVRDHLQNPNPVSTKEALNLPEDFVFDADEALANPKSPSAKVLDTYVSRVVDSKTAKTEQKIHNTIASENNKRANAAEAEAWRQKNNMSKEEFANMMNKASEHTIGYDDINLILNGATVKKNVAKNAKADVQKQMSAARRNAPPTASAVGSVGANENMTEDDKIFSALKGLDNNSNLFDS
jgi:DNA-binding transcriptional regulator YiaG